MIYIDENGTALENVELSLGYLEDAEWIDHPEIEQKGHFEYKKLSGKGRQQNYVIDTPYKPAWREVTKQRYIPYTEDELAIMAKNDHAARLSALEAETYEQRNALKALIGGVSDA